MPKAKLKDILGPNTSRSDAFSKVKHTLTQMGFSVTEVNDKRPWGGYLVIEPAHTPLFLETFFADKELPSWLKDKYLSPKVMLWAPGEILSWQYHNKREEHWKVVAGPVVTFLSETDQQPESPDIYQMGEIIEIPNGVRHRGGGHESWGIIAEIWGHVDPGNLSTEEDIVRLADRYNRA